VLRILGKEDGEVVENEEIDRIRKAISDGQVLRPHPPIATGIRVRVVDGVFADVEGVVTELRSNSKVVISMAAVKQCYSLEINICNLEILDKKVLAPRGR
jgi:transcription antitermination factor NusG